MCASAVIVAVTGCILAMPTGIGFDAAPGLLASEQRLAGWGNRLDEMVVVDPARLERDAVQRIAWWPPGQQYVVHALRVAGLSLAQALDVAVLGAWLVGIAAWSVYIWVAVADKRTAPWLIAAFALFRPSHTGGFQYTGGEIFLWSAVPVVVLVHLLALRWRGAALALASAAAGCLAVGLVLLKYSGGILAVGLGLAWIWWSIRRRLGVVAIAGWMAGALCGAALALGAGVFDGLMGNNPVTASRAHQPLAALVWGVLGPLDALADGTETATTIARRLGAGPLTETASAVVALALTAPVLGWLVTARRQALDWRVDSSPRGAALRIGLGVTAVIAVALVALRLGGADVSWETRHQQYGPFLLLPFVAEALLAGRRAPSTALRRASVVCLALFVTMPAVYGAAVLIRRTAVGPVGLDREWSRDGPGASPALAELSSATGFESAVLATIHPRTALSFPTHRILFVMHLRPGESFDSPDASWRAARFQGRPDGGVAVLLPPGVSATDTRVLLDSFDDVRSWRRVPLARVPDAQLWMGQ